MPRPYECQSEKEVHEWVEAQLALYSLDKAHYASHWNTYRTSIYAQTNARIKELAEACASR